jgi:hypothetical protein
VNLLQQQIQIPLFAFPLVKHAELQEISLSKADADADVEVNDTAAIFHKFESKRKKSNNNQLFDPFYVRHSHSFPSLILKSLRA